FVDASNFPDPYGPQHTLYVRARNEFGTIETEYSTQTFNTVYPAWQRPGYQQRFLIINADHGYSDSVSSWNPTLDSIEIYYSSIMDNIGYQGKYDIVRSSPDFIGKIVPGLGTMALYRATFLIADIINYPPALPTTGTIIDNRTLKAYVNVGG